jgi:hypothetical protein
MDPEEETGIGGQVDYEALYSFDIHDYVWEEGDE